MLVNHCFIHNTHVLDHNRYFRNNRSHRRFLHSDPTGCFLTGTILCCRCDRNGSRFLCLYDTFACNGCNLGIVNKAVLQVTLNKAKVLQTSDFAVSSKVYGYGSFVRKCVIDHLETTDNITYKLYLDKHDIFYNGDIVQVSVPTLNSTKELTYRTKPTEITIR